MSENRYSHIGPPVVPPTVMPTLAEAPGLALEISRLRHDLAAADKRVSQLLNEKVEYIEEITQLLLTLIYYAAHPGPEGERARRVLRYDETAKTRNKFRHATIQENNGAGLPRDDHHIGASLVPVQQETSLIR